MSESTSRPVSLEQLVALNDEIAALVRAGVPLELGLREMGVLSGGEMGDISTSLARRMQAGASLTDALRAEEDRIPPVYRSVVEAGLRAGRLSAALEAMTNFARELIELRRQISSALVYPLIVVGLAYGLFLVFTVDLIERFREAYAVFHFPLHGALRWLAWVSDRIATWWWGPPAIVIGLILWWWTTGGAHILSFTGTSRPLSWIPGVGRIGRYFQYANFAELLALLVEHQVPLAESLRLSADATGDRRLKQAAYRMADAAIRGEVMPLTAYLPKKDSILSWYWEWFKWRHEWFFSLIRLIWLGPAEFPPFLHWVLWQASNGANPVRLLRHAANFYRRRAVNLTNWFKLTFPILAAIVIGGGITTMYALALFGPLATLWKDLVVDQ